MRLTRTGALVAAVALGAGTLGFAPATDASVDAFADSANIEHLGQIEYPQRQQSSPANGGTDLEFVTLTVAPEKVVGYGHASPDVDADPDTDGLQRTYAVAGSYDNGVHIIDVTVPGEEARASIYECGLYQGDIQIFTRDDLPGRTFATTTQDSLSSIGLRNGDACITAVNQQRRFGTYIFEITDPTAPVTLSFAPFDKGSHNMTVHPSGKYLYNSNSELITNARAAAIEVTDITDLAKPKAVTTLPLPPRPGLGTDSHDITFNADGTRAYSAALSQTVIIDTSKPAAPRIVTSFVDPAINVEHQANPITIDDPILGERDFLIVEDEFAGAAGAEQTCPSGGVHVWDITDETLPVKVGYWNIDDVTSTEPNDVVNPLELGSCTAHVFQLHEEEQLMTIAFYTQGVSVVDLSGLVGVALGANGVGMEEVAYAHFTDSNTWAVKAPSVTRDGTFAMYGNDLNRGFDGYEVTLDLPAVGESALLGASVGTGRDVWLSPEAALQRARLAGPADLTDYRPFCLLGSTER
ncbi:MAG: LVIVD repeat-containing protein [Actinomycetes bacterium]